MNITSRETWGASYGSGWGSRSLPAAEAWLHHSVTTHLPTTATVAQEKTQMRVLERIGQSRFGGGISYTYVVFPSGRVYEGHDVSRKGAHTMGHNTVGIGICWAGNYDTHKPSTQALDATSALLQTLEATGKLRTARLNGGHRDVYGTACPGRYGYAAIAAINLKAAGAALGNIVDDLAEVTTERLRKGDNGAKVRRLQQSILNRLYGSLAAKSIAETGGADGKAGDGFYDAVKLYQKDHGLDVDGVVGPNTWAQLNKDGIYYNKTTAPPLLKQGSAPYAPTKWMQYGLIGLGGGPANYIKRSGGADGKFGPGTKDAVQGFQRKHKLDPDGVVGSKTWDKLAEFDIYPAYRVLKD